MGAIATGGVRVINQDVIRALYIPPQVLDDVAFQEQQELERRERLYRDNRPLPVVRDQTVILIDDGLATGATVRAAVQALRVQEPAKIVVAVPVAAYQTYRQFRTEVDEIICPQTPEVFYGVGWWYEDFSQTSDQQVRELLSLSAHENPASMSRH
jgi:putative phosphoribosyl transferase